MSWLFTSGGQSIGASASSSVLPLNIQDDFRIDWLDPLAVQGTLKSLLQHHNFESINSSSQPKAKAKETQASLWSNSHIRTRPLGKIRALIIANFVGEVMSLLFNMLSMFVLKNLPH